MNREIIKMDGVFVSALLNSLELENVSSLFSSGVIISTNPHMCPRVGVKSPHKRSETQRERFERRVYLLLRPLFVPDHVLRLLFSKSWSRPSFRFGPRVNFSAGLFLQVWRWRIITMSFFPISYLRKEIKCITDRTAFFDARMRRIERFAACEKNMVSISIILRIIWGL